MVLDRHPRDVAAACCYLGLKITGADEILEVLNRKGGNGGRGEGDEGFRNVSELVDGEPTASELTEPSSR